MIAPCSADPELFFPISGHSEKAKALCSRCPMKSECLNLIFSLETAHGRQHGVWAGFTADERKALWDAEEFEAWP